MASCKSKSGSLLKVEQIKFIDLRVVRTVSKYPIFRIDAIKGKPNNFLTTNHFIFVLIREKRVDYLYDKI